MIGEDAEIKKAFLSPLLKILEFKMLPVVYGDVVLDNKKGCFIASTEKILSFLALKLKAKFGIEKVIHCGKTDGVYDKQGKTIPKISTESFDKVRAEIGGSDGIDVTGGMFHKIEEALTLAKNGIPSVIINGARPGELLNALLGKFYRGTEVI